MVNVSSASLPVICVHALGHAGPVDIRRVWSVERLLCFLSAKLVGNGGKTIHGLMSSVSHFVLTRLGGDERGSGRYLIISVPV